MRVSANFKGGLEGHGGRQGHFPGGCLEKLQGRGELHTGLSSQARMRSKKGDVEAMLETGPRSPPFYLGYSKLSGRF